MNQRELDVLEVLWNTNTEMTATDIVNTRKGLTQSTVIAVLRKLTSDGLVDVAGVTHSGKVLSRTYRPTEKSKEAILNEFVSLYNMFRNVVSVEELTSRLQQ